MNKMLIAGAIAGGLSLAAFGASAGPRGGGDEHWEHMDANGDGEITAKEISGRSAEMIKKADADGNGAVSREEMKAFHEARRAEWREKHNPDKNADGVVDRTEFINAAQKQFEMLDKNGDGVLSEDEQPRRGHRGHHGKRGE